VIDWLATRAELEHLPIGLFGASTGAAAAILAAIQRPQRVAAIVSRGGRTDLAGSQLQQLHAPILQIVGGHDRVILERNRKVSRALTCEQCLEVIPRASHLFEEPGILQEAARLAGEWFVTRLCG